MRFTPLDFFVRPSGSPDFDIPYIGPIYKVSEKYWSFGRKCTIIVNDGSENRLAIGLIEKNMEWWRIALKVAACVTIIPLILLGVKLINRWVHPYKMIAPAVRQSDPPPHPEPLPSNPTAIERIEQSAHKKSSKKGLHLQFQVEETRYSLANHPLTITKKQSNLPAQSWSMAEEAFAENAFESAFLHYMNYALSTMNETETWNEKGFTAVKRVLMLHKEVLRKEIVTIHEEDSPEAIKRDFFTLIAFIRDHTQVRDSAAIAEKIARPITPDKGVQTYVIQTSLPINDSKLIKKECNGYSYGVYSIQGMADKMEDTFSISSFTIPQKTLAPVCASLFALFDGHGGKNCSDYLAEHFASSLAKTFDKYKSDLSDTFIFNVFKETCINFNNEIKSLLQKSKIFSGSTASVLLILDNKEAWCMNVGDSRIVLKFNDNNEQCTEDAKPEKPKFRNSILKRGGTVVFKKGMWRVDGDIALSRSFGDFHVPGMTARPKLTKWDLSGLNPESNSFFVLATDGLWDVMGTHNALDLIHCTIPEQERSPTVTELPQYLAHIAETHGSQSMDNITVIAVDLKKR